ncbi:MAG: hypothetical protein FH753_17055 [Firmicutes bacterium]|nr:hypothetical protein [Bacillota bacterium]
MFKEIRNPDLYHGKNKKKFFFEGWYYKVCDKFNDRVFAFIPGIVKGKDKKSSHSFIQVLDGKNSNYNYIKYSENYFKYNNKVFQINIDKNYFSLDKLNLDLKFNNKTIKGNLKLKNIKKWPDTFINPGSMGFYNYFWFMECYSQVCAQNGEIEGALNIDNEMIDFTGGKVYIEKNWGHSFPKSWIWIQSNSFDNKNIAFTCSVGKVPFLFGSFSGFLVGLNIDDVFYSFTTINKSKMKIKEYENDVEIIFKRKNLLLKVKTKSRKEKFISCMGPKRGNMIPLVKENLKGEVILELKDIKKSKVIYKGIGKSTGIEYGGDQLYFRV